MAALAVAVEAQDHRAGERRRQPGVVVDRHAQGGGVRRQQQHRRGLGLAVVGRVLRAGQVHVVAIRPAVVAAGDNQVQLVVRQQFVLEPRVGAVDGVARILRLPQPAGGALHRQGQRIAQALGLDGEAGGAAFGPAHGIAADQAMRLRAQGFRTRPGRVGRVPTVGGAVVGERADIEQQVAARIEYQADQRVQAGVGQGGDPGGAADHVRPGPGRIGRVEAKHAADHAHVNPPVGSQGDAVRQVEHRYYNCEVRPISSMMVADFWPFFYWRQPTISVKLFQSESVESVKSSVRPTEKN